MIRHLKKFIKWYFNAYSKMYSTGYITPSL